MHQSPIPLPERESYTKHRREFIQQILLPVVLAVLLGFGAMALVGLATFRGNGDVSRWAAVATIWLVAPILVLALAFIVITWGLVYLLQRLLKITPHYTGLTQTWLLWLNAEIVLWVEKLTHPLVMLKAWLGMISRERK